jgi:hypothetical protein
MKEQIIKIGLFKIVGSTNRIVIKTEKMDIG